MPTVSQHSFGKYCWVDLSTTDPESARTFYGNLMGWEFDNLYDNGNFVYSMILLDGQHVAGMGQLQPAQIEAGMPPCWNSYVCVEDARATARKCESLGAQVLAGPMDIFDSGVLAALADPNGAVFSLWQPKVHRGFQVMMEPSSYLWAELYAHKPAEDAAFYQAAFGWDVDADPNPDNPGYYMFTQEAREGSDEWERRVAGILQIRPEMGPVPPHWNVYFQVADVDASLQKALDLGGEQLHPMVEIPMGGRLVGIKDPQGAVFTVMQMAAHMHA